MAGLWFEEFKDGMVFNHEWSRTITEADNMWFSLLTMNPHALHIDAHYAAKTEWGKAAGEQPVHARADDRHVGQ